MIGEFVKYIKSKKLFSPGDKVLLAVSGGVDSMVMLDLFAKAGFSFGIAHCNFTLRGKESDADEKFIRKFAGRNNYPLHTKRFDTVEYSRRTGTSIQVAARELRYGFFESVRKKEKYHSIATAHNLNDAAETFLFNLSRGTGISGLRGIAVKTGHVIRPLLSATREMIFDYARINNISWREDSSNLSLKYSRNLIRHKVVPVFMKLNPNFLKTLSAVMGRVESSENFITKWIGMNHPRMVKKERNRIFLDMEEIRNWNEPVLLHFLIREYGFSFDQALWILQASGKQPGAQFHSGSHLITCDRNRLVIEPVRQGPEVSWRIAKGQSLLDTGQGDQYVINLVARPDNLKFPPNIALLDEMKLNYPLVIRAPKRGDRFRPFGMKGEQKLSDFMINHKIPRSMKRNVRVITSNEAIVWVAGYRISEDFKVTDETKRVLKIEYVR
ncbi:MAG TPA: tRNA lysidine(34) synthetase TilS [Cyclobacteriaceae bacterium]|nr:tRNA lysidine(34) synthetase TilS [Cyclobacteriaceae bacterium]